MKSLSGGVILVALFLFSAGPVLGQRMNQVSITEMKQVTVKTKKIVKKCRKQLKSAYHSHNKRKIKLSKPILKHSMVNHAVAKDLLVVLQKGGTVKRDQFEGCRSINSQLTSAVEYLIVGKFLLVHEVLIKVEEINKYQPQPRNLTFILNEYKGVQQNYFNVFVNKNKIKQQIKELKNGSKGRKCKEVVDCAGVCGGNAVVDCADKCGGSAVKDCTGKCGGNATTDCAGTCGGKAVKDCAGKCGGNAIADCAGVCNGNATTDCAGTCGGKAVKDCTGECGGYVVVDCAGKCGGNSIADCAGKCGGHAPTDCAGICNGNTVVDCAGTCGGKAVTDCAGKCGGSDENCIGRTCISAPGTCRKCSDDGIILADDSYNLGKLCYSCQGGLVRPDNGSPCNDYDPCTHNDSCSSGLCKGERDISPFIPCNPVIQQGQKR